MSSTKSRSRSLKVGRPPLTSDSTSAFNRSETKTSSSVNARRKSAKATRTLINKHHQLQKTRAKALSEGDRVLVGTLDEQLQALGGLHAYQAASLTGQDKDRGGDSSEKLVEWLSELDLIQRRYNKPLRVRAEFLEGSDQLLTVHQRRPLRVLEIGALSSKNAISGAIGKGVEMVKRVDLHSQEPDFIEEIDFMDLAVPVNDDERFDVISLSLVLNFVPDAKVRGEMLKRTVQFLRSNTQRQTTPSEVDASSTGEVETGLPLLFLVLPLACVTNSRYMNLDHLKAMMQVLGYTTIRNHQSQKLQYILFKHEASSSRGVDGHKLRGAGSKSFKKAEINPGRTRNNFSVVLSWD